MRGIIPLIMIGFFVCFLVYSFSWKYRVEYDKDKIYDLNSRQTLYDLKIYHWYHGDIIRFEYHWNVSIDSVEKIKKSEDSIGAVIKKQLEEK